MKNEIIACDSLSDNVRKGFVAELDGRAVKTRFDYFSAIDKAFQFPTSSAGNWDSYLDWIRDLTWLPDGEITLIIQHYANFLEDNPEDKKMLVEDFEDTILPFWEEEVTHVVVEGKPRHFMVYLVN